MNDKDADGRKAGDGDRMDRKKAIATREETLGMRFFPSCYRLKVNLGMKPPALPGSITSFTVSILLLQLSEGHTGNRGYIDKKSTRRRVSGDDFFADGIKNDFRRVVQV